MRLPPYRLKTLLEVRERNKEAAEQRLAVCLKALHDEKEKLKVMELELERMIAKREKRLREYLEKAMKGEVSAMEAISQDVYNKRLKELEKVQMEAIEGQKGVIRQRQEDVETARQALVVANQELKALEKHKENWIKQVKKEQAAKEENTLDELAQTIYLRSEKP